MSKRCKKPFSAHGRYVAESALRLGRICRPFRRTEDGRTEKRLSKLSARLLADTECADRIIKADVMPPCGCPD